LLQINQAVLVIPSKQAQRSRIELNYTNLLSKLCKNELKGTGLNYFVCLVLSVECNWKERNWVELTIYKSWFSSFYFLHAKAATAFSAS